MFPLRRSANPTVWVGGRWQFCPAFHCCCRRSWAASFLREETQQPPPLTKVFCTKPNPGCRCCTTPAWWWCCLDRPYPGTVLGLLSTGLKLSASSLMPPPEAADTPTPRPTTAYNLLGTLAGTKPCSDLATPTTLLPQSLATNQGIGCHRHV